ncbi:MAG: DUF2066 domain-containing protein [Gammaproteobacteria bacterium]
MISAVLAVFFWFQAATAGQVEGLYRSTVPVTGQEAGEREKAIRTGFVQVLIKVTGESRLEERPELKSLLQQAPQYLQQFRYEKRVLPTRVPGQESVESMELHLQFDAESVNDALRRHGLPVWGDLRPTILVWLAVEEGAKRYLVGADSDPAIVSVVTDAAERRGLPILFPLLDLEDRAAVSVADVWGNFQSAIERASKRYQPDAILVGRVFRQADGRWEAIWTLYHDGAQSPWLSSGVFTSQVLFHGIDNASDLLAARFAPIGMGALGNEFLLHVEGIDSLERYARLSGYLSGLQPVKSVRPARVRATSMTFHLQVEGDYRLLQQLIGLSDVLKPVADEPSEGQTQLAANSLPVIRYRVGP